MKVKKKKNNSSSVSNNKEDSEEINNELLKLQRIEVEEEFRKIQEIRNQVLSLLL